MGHTRRQVRTNAGSRRVVHSFQTLAARNATQRNSEESGIIFFFIALLRESRKIF
jgi:hypothetical protein